MKARPISPILPGIVAGVALLLAGCAKGDAGTAQTPTAAASPDQPAVITAETPAAPPLQPPPPAQLDAPPPGPAPGPVVAPPPRLSPGAEEVVRLAQAQLGDEVLLAYIENSATPFNLDVNEILYLNDLGISSPVIAAMVRQDQYLQEQGAPTETIAPPPPAENPDAVAVADEPAPTEITNNYYYSALAPYGSWVEVEDYGWCWRPTVAVVNTSWQPYCDGGRWVYSDCGWYWNSYYSWGWAPFHYGRWYRSPACGWVWRPGYTWGPAWVTWRYSAGYCGWAPLPPACGYVSGVGLTWYGRGVSVGFGFGLSSACYTFVPTPYFASGTVWTHRVAHGQTTQVYQNSTVINNYVDGKHNNTIINVGPGTSTIASASRSEIRQVTLRDADTRGGRVVNPERLSADGSTLAVYRPRVPQQSTTPPTEILQRQEQRTARVNTVASSDAAQRAIRSSQTRARVPSQSSSVRSTAPAPSVTRGPESVDPRASAPVVGSRSPTRAPTSAASRTTSRPSEPAPSPSAQPTRSPSVSPSVRPVTPSVRSAPTRSVTPSVRSVPPRSTTPSAQTPSRTIQSTPSNVSPDPRSAFRQPAPQSPPTVSRSPNQRLTPAAPAPTPSPRPYRPPSTVRPMSPRIPQQPAPSSSIVRPPPPSSRTVAPAPAARPVSPSRPSSIQSAPSRAPASGRSLQPSGSSRSPSSASASRSSRSR